MLLYHANTLTSKKERHTMIKSIYLAGPGVFFPDAQEHIERKRSLCEKHGFKGLSPLDNELSSNISIPHDLSREIFDANIALMDLADCVIADLTPFRGASADAGTVFEIGYMRAKGKPVLGYSNISLEYQSRIDHQNFLDENGHRIENFGLADNLMIAHGCDAFVSHASDKPFFDLNGFEECLIKLKNF